MRSAVALIALAALAPIAGCSLMFDFNQFSPDASSPDVGAVARDGAAADAGPSDAEADAGEEPLGDSGHRDAARRDASPGDIGSSDAEVATLDAQAPGPDAAAGRDASGAPDVGQVASGPDAAADLDGGCAACPGGYECVGGECCETDTTLCAQSSYCGSFYVNDSCGVQHHPSCPAKPGCYCSGNAQHELYCDDGIDNDGDGLTDLADTDCGCAPGVASESFPNPGMPAMVGCVGKVTFENRNTLCGTGMTACSARQVANRLGTASPSYVYWTADALSHVMGSVCMVMTRATAAHNTLVPCDHPLRVCPIATGADPKGNQCDQPTGCQLENYQGTGDGPNVFGGCNELQASTLCCAAVSTPCTADATPEKFSNGIFGCKGSVSRSDADQLCDSHCHLCTAHEWSILSPAPVAALNNYWLADQDLDILAGSGGCYAAPKGQVKCQSPGTAHICGSKDELGNKCGQGGCGYLAGSDAAYLGDVFGGCLFDETAGALCCCD